MGTPSFQRRREYEADVARLRRLVNRTPWLNSTHVDGEPVMTDTLGQIAVRFDGPWSSDLQRFFDHFTHGSFVALLGLVEDAHGTNAERAARKFLDLLRLSDEGREG